MKKVNSTNYYDKDGEEYWVVGYFTGDLEEFGAYHPFGWNVILEKGKVESKKNTKRFSTWEI